MSILTLYKGVSRWPEKGDRPFHIFRGFRKEKRKKKKTTNFFFGSRQRLWICHLVTVLCAADGDFDSGMKYWGELWFKIQAGSFSKLPPKIKTFARNSCIDDCDINSLRDVHLLVRAARAKRNVWKRTYLWRESEKKTTKKQKTWPPAALRKKLRIPNEGSWIA